MNVFHPLRRGEKKKTAAPLSKDRGAEQKKRG